MKAIGSGAVLGATGVAAASASQNNGFKGLIQASHNILENQSREDRNEFLKDHGILGSQSRYVYEVDRGEDEVGTESFDSDELDIVQNLWHNCSDGQYYAELIWEYDWFFSSGADPNDRVGIGFESQWWDYESISISETTETSSNVTPEESEFGDGPAFKVNDRTASSGEQYYAGVYLEPTGNYTADERRVQGGYSHVWEDVEISSVSVSYPVGVSVSVSEETYEWRTQTEIDGDTLLRVSQEDSNFCS